MEPKTKTQSVQCLAQHNLWLRVPRLDKPHPLRSLRRECIDHSSPIARLVACKQLEEGQAPDDIAWHVEGLVEALVDLQ